MFKEIEIIPHPRRKERAMPATGPVEINQLVGKKSYLRAIECLAQYKNFSVTTTRTEVAKAVEVIKALVRQHSATDMTMWMTAEEVLKHPRRATGAVRDYIDPLMHDGPKRKFIENMNEEGAWSAALAGADHFCRQYAKGKYYTVNYLSNSPQQNRQEKNFATVKEVCEFLVRKYRINTKTAARVSAGAGKKTARTR